MQNVRLLRLRCSDPSKSPMFLGKPCAFSGVFFASIHGGLLVENSPRCLACGHHQNIHSPSSTHPTSLNAFTRDEPDETRVSLARRRACFSASGSLRILSSNQRPCVRTFRSVDTHPRSTQVSLRLVHLNPYLCGFLLPFSPPVLPLPSCP